MNRRIKRDASIKEIKIVELKPFPIQQDHYEVLMRIQEHSLNVKND